MFEVVIAAVYRTWISAMAISPPSDPTDLWQWFMENITVQGSLNIAGLALLVVLFSRDLILTRGQHERRVLDITGNYEKRLAENAAFHGSALEAMKTAHAEALAGKDARYSDLQARYDEMKESRNYYRASRLQEKDDKESAMSALVEANQGLQVAARALAALDQLAQQEVGGIDDSP